MLRAKYINKVTEVNKIYLENIINEGDIVVDATMGNGYDTVYLAKKVGPKGKVYAFDVQEEALKSTSKKVAREELENVELILDGHQNMDKYVQEEVSCIVFKFAIVFWSKKVNVFFLTCYVLVVRLIIFYSKKYYVIFVRTSYFFY